MSANNKAKGSPKWMATFADLMSLLMAMFVLLYAMSDVSEEKFKRMAASFSEESGVVSQVIEDSAAESQAEPIGLKPLYESLIELFNHQSKNGEVSVTYDEDEQGIFITFPGDLAFEKGKADLTREFQRALIKFFILREYRDTAIEVIGHTDSIPIKSYRFRSNWELSSSRASSVTEFLIEKGYALPGNIRSVGLGDTHRISKSDNELYKDRRVEIKIYPKKDESTTQADS